MERQAWDAAAHKIALITGRRYDHLCSERNSRPKKDITAPPEFTHWQIARNPKFPLWTKQNNSVKILIGAIYYAHSFSVLVART